MIMKKQGTTTIQSPRALATREKNREAVRKCRQRKRERTEELKTRCDELSRENVRLRMRLELGNEQAKEEKAAKGKLLIKEMERLLEGLENKLADKEKSFQKDALDMVYQQFFERHMELGPDKLSSLSFVVKRLHGLLDPDALTKAYLYILTLDGKYFNEDEPLPVSEHNWWIEFCQELELSEEQKRQIKLRRLTGHRAKAELFYVAQRAESMSKSILERKHLAQSFLQLMRIFTTAQIAKFIVWVSNDPCGNELLDMLWSELMESIDQELSKEQLHDEVSDTRALEVQRLLNAVRQENGMLFKSVFESPDIRDAFKKAKRIFTDDVVLIDPSNGGEYHGLDQVMRYVEKMRRAFTPTSLKLENYRLFDSSLNHSNEASSPSSPAFEVKFKEKSLEFTGDKAIGKFQVQGSYHGRLLDEVSRSNHDKVLVECESVVSITFAESSAKIKELVVSNDLVGLFQSLGNKLDPHAAAIAAAAATTAASRSSKIEYLPQIELFQAKCKNLLSRLKALFQENDPEVSLGIATEILSDKCVFVDSNMGTDHRGVDECSLYIKRIRSAFPKLKVIEESVDIQHKQPKDRIQIEWLVEAAYGGKLASKDAPKPCFLKGILFLVTEDGERINSLAMSWNATDLLRELGVQLKDEDRMGQKRLSSAREEENGRLSQRRQSIS